MKNKKSYLLGLTLVGTINSIKDFGELGDNILKDLGVRKIDPNKFYHFNYVAKFMTVFIKNLALRDFFMQDLLIKKM